jgi:iron complex transport system ATP-binding protein
MLSIKNLSAGYNGKNVINSLSFDLNFGKCLSVIGPNGCGKTTLLKCIAHIIDYEGSITLSDIELNTLNRRKLASKIAVMSQLNSMYFSYSVYDTVMLGRFLHIKSGVFGGSPSENDTKAVENSLRAVGLWELRDRQINTLSGGQLQRVFLARVLSQNPQIILLDEPTNHLDLKHQIELVDYIREWAEKKGASRAVIGVFHDMNIALRLTKNVLLMDSGKVGRIGKFTDIADSSYLQNLFGTNVVDYMTSCSAVWQNMKSN